MHFILAVLIGFLALLFWPRVIDTEPMPIPPESVLAHLSEVDKIYYRQVFNYTMTAVDSGVSYSWETSESRGAISASKPFTSKSDATCRSFTESFSVREVRGKDSGVACKREGLDGWCRLKNNAEAMTCAFENRGVMDDASRGTHGVIEAGKGFLGKLQGWVR